jgi:hypothetical protein
MCRKSLTAGLLNVLVLFMSGASEMAERHGRILAELAELGLSLARGLHARAGAAETPQDAERLALAFHGLSRSVRLTLALEARLERERLKAAREDRDHAARDLRERVYVRKAQVRAAVTRQVLAEAETEGEDAEALLDDLHERLEEEALYEAFALGPVEACIARIRSGLGLAPEPCANDPQPPAAVPRPPGPPEILFDAAPAPSPARPDARRILSG